MNARIATLVIVVLLVGSLPAGIAGASAAAPSIDTDAGTDGLESTASTSDHDAATALTDADDVIYRTTELRHRPDRPGEFEAEVRVAVPDAVSGLAVVLESDADVAATEGFESVGDGRYEWTEDVDEPSIRFTMPADRTGLADRDRHETVDGYTFHDAGDWAIVRVPFVGLSYQQPESVDVGVEETTTVDGAGATGGDIAVFGPVEEHERTVDGETIRLAVPHDAALYEDPDDVLEALAAASERLAVGDRNAETFVVAAPGDADWGPRGVQYGDGDAWVVDDAPLEAADNVWLHEYVHTRQGFAGGDTATDAAWIVEAQAEYYAGLLAKEQGLISFSEFRTALERGERSPYADGILAEPATWTDVETDYVKGPLVYGELDRKLRLASDGDRTLDDVFRQLNAQDDSVTGTDLLEAIERAGGTELRDSAERYTETTATPDAWNRFEHRAAFGPSGATVTYGLGDDPPAVTGQEWDVWDRDALTGPSADLAREKVLAVPAGERVDAPVVVANVDDRSGTADATLQVDGEIVDSDRHVLEGGERATTTLSWVPPAPGVYDVRVGKDRATVYVRSTPSLHVTELRAEPDSVGPGDEVTVMATVTTADELPAAGTLEVRNAAGTTAAEPIALAPGETERLETELTFDDDGEYEVTVGGESTTITVGGLRSKLESMPGFGVGVAVVAAGLAVLVGLGRRRRQ
ncbi:hypothetical protein RBH26_06705 [Natronolimnohabitans sp. A-GB9]|uniref:hypothetical protein n=1 Tax=Natronolimnohabitans sp. A-GB9 TaxID=3069757 RepID=UPI0027B49AF9|nr:hypothetical protein [Natronolimnohabitans sp. A-GB9]MDQ2050172.1 hypothetical protein [Natronolimnohabitans sp. A-GB9]